MRYHPVLLTLMLITMLTLTTCGGGDGNGPGAAEDDPRLTGDLTPGNYASVGADVVKVLDAAGFASLAVGAIPVALRGVSDGSAARGRRLLLMPAVWASLPPPHEQHLDVYPIGEPCAEGGYTTGSIFDRDGNGVLSTGDAVVMSYVGCGMGGEVVSGDQSMSVIGLVSFGPVQAAELEFIFGNLGNQALRYSGAVRVVLTIDGATGTEQLAMAFREMLVSLGGRTYHWGFTATYRRTSSGMDSASFAGHLGMDGQTFMLRQPAPFTFSEEGLPAGGHVAVIDADGDRLEVEAGQNRYLFRYFSIDNLGNLPDAQSDGPPYLMAPPV